MANYEKIEQIQIDGYAPGMWQNSVIISADFDIGFGEKPTKFVINVINPTGQYATPKFPADKELSYLDAHNIKCGPFRFRFYLEAYQFQKSGGVRRLQLTFVDGSTLLDRIYVALQDKHNQIDERSTFPTEVYFPMLCDAPEQYPQVWNGAGSNGLVNLSKRTYYPVKYSWGDPNSILQSPNLEAGGMITVGWTSPTLENFSYDCNVEESHYNFGHLLFMIEKFGIRVQGDFIKYPSGAKKIWTNRLLDRWGGTIFVDRNPFHYKSIGGVTLRQALNQWCELQGFSWTYDWEMNAINGIDLYTNDAWKRYEEVRKIIGSVDTDSGQYGHGFTSTDPANGVRDDVLIETASETCTLAGTKKKYVTTKAIKNAKPDQPTNYDYYRPTKFYPVDIGHVIPANQRGSITGLRDRFRDDTSFRISCGLAKFGESEALEREIFNAAIGCHEANGVQIIAELDLLNHPGISGSPMSQLALQVVNAACLGKSDTGKELLKTLNTWTQFQKIPFKVYFAKYHEKLENNFRQWEKNIAEQFLGRHYLNFDHMHNFERCDVRGLGNFRRVDSTLPSSTIFKRLDVAQGKQGYPWGKDITKDPYGLRINSNLFGINPVTGVARFDQFNMLTRDSATFETSQKQVDDIMKPGNNSSHYLEEWQPVFIKTDKIGKGVGGGMSFIGQYLPHLNVFNGQTNVTNWPANMFTGSTMMNAASIMNALYVQNQAAMPNAPEFGIYIHPDYSHPNFPFKIKNVSYYKYTNDKEKSIENNSQLSYQTSWGQDSCPLACGGVSPRQLACDGLQNRFKSKAYPSGLERANFGNLVNQNWQVPAFGFQMEIAVPPMNAQQGWRVHTVDMTYPSWAPYIVNHKSNVFRRLLDPKVMMIINGMRYDHDRNGVLEPPGNVSQVEVVENDVTKMLTPTPGGEISLNLMGVNQNPFTIGGNFHLFGKNRFWDVVKLADMHEDYVITSELPTQDALYAVPRKRITCSVAGLNFGSLAKYCDPAHGLEAVSIRMNNEGISTEISFSNKPPKALEFEMTHRTIQTDLVRAGGTYPMY